MGKMERVMNFACRLCQMGLWVGGADELAGYALALGTTWSLGAALPGPAKK